MIAVNTNRIQCLRRSCRRLQRKSDLVDGTGKRLSEDVLKQDCKPEPLLDCICCAMVAIATRQGESSRLKIRKPSPPEKRLGTMSVQPCNGYCIFYVPPVTFARTPMVETIASAVKPERSRHQAATAKAQRCKQRRDETTDDSHSAVCGSSTRPKLPFSANQIRQGATLLRRQGTGSPALMMKPFSLSLLRSSTVFSLRNMD